MDKGMGNPHQLGLEAKLSQTAIKPIWDSEEIPDTTKVGTLRKIALALKVPVWFLFNDSPSLKDGD